MGNSSCCNVDPDKTDQNNDFAGQNMLKDKNRLAMKGAKPEQTAVI